MTTLDKALAEQIELQYDTQAQAVIASVQRYLDRSGKPLTPREVGQLLLGVHFQNRLALDSILFTYVDGTPK